MGATTSLGDDRPGRLGVFAYAVAEKAAQYVAIMDAFVRARERYAIQLTLDQLRSELGDRGVAPTNDLRWADWNTASESDLEASVEQLVAWGNLSRVFDPTAPRTLRDFYNRRWLYQLTDMGLAAHHGVASVLNGPVGAGGRLSTVLLETVADHLADLAELAERAKNAQGSDAAAAIGAALSRTFSGLFGASAQLADYAARYMADLAIEVPRIAQDEDALSSYKQAVIAYLEGFVSTLSRRAEELARMVAAIDPQLSDLAALADAVDRGPSLARGEWSVPTSTERHWQGVRSWFVEGGQASLLRDAMLRAICRLLEAIELVDLDHRRISRAQDFFSLAARFATCTTTEAHMLFDTAFGIYGSRHFVQEAGDESVWRGASFAAADPAAISPRLRKAGTRASPGRPGIRSDFSQAKARQLSVLRDRRRRQWAARHGLAARTPAQLSAVGGLEAEEFSELLALVGAALDAGRATTRQARTGDTQIMISVGTGRAALEAPSGVLVGPDMWLDIRLESTYRGRGHL